MGQPARGLPRRRRGAGGARARRSRPSSASARRSSSTTASAADADLHPRPRAALRRPPEVGTAWLLAREGEPAERAAAAGRRGRGARTTAEALTFVSARAEWSPPWELIELRRPAEVRRSTGRPAAARTNLRLGLGGRGGRPGALPLLSLADGVGEDEATGSAAIMLAAATDRELLIHQGEGSLLRARSLGDGWAEVGGRLRLDVRSATTRSRVYQQLNARPSCSLGSLTGSWQAKFSQT